MTSSWPSPPVSEPIGDRRVRSLERRRSHGESIQGLLEEATWYDGKTRRITALSTNPGQDSFNILAMLRQLEKEGYLFCRYSEMGDGMLRVEAMQLTVSGYKLLDELRAKALPRKIKGRALELAWVVITSIVTTLIVLYLQSK